MIHIDMIHIDMIHNQGDVNRVNVSHIFNVNCEPVEVNHYKYE